MEQNAETKYDLTAEQLRRLPQEAYLLVDMRDEIAYGHGRIPGAVRMDRERLLGGDCPLPPDRKIIVYCMKGLFSREVARRLAGKGYEAYHLAGGYGQWLLDLMRADGIQKEADSPQDDPCTAREHSPDSALDDFQAQIEKSLRKKFYRTIFSKFTKAINQYELLREGDRVAVCISGGKDSMLMAKLFQELLRHHKFPFELVFLVMDPGYDELNRKIIESNARLLRIPITVFETQIFDAVYQVEKSPCYLCARMRRGHLYRKAQELGCNKIALGHHYDDVIETILMGMLYGGQVQTMMPKLRSTSFEGMELIRPMYLIREDDIRHWREYHGLHFIQCACRFTDTCTACRDDGRVGSKRMETKQLIRRLKESNPYVEANIFKSVENVNLSTVIAYKEDGAVHHFLEKYEDSVTHPPGVCPSVKCRQRK